MQYTGRFINRYSKLLNRDITIMEYSSNDKIPYCDCDRCGKPIIRKMYVVQDPKTDLEIMYLGSECIKNI